MFKNEYGTSHALIIGIDVYVSAPPLRFAVSDATGVKAAIESLGFKSENVQILLNQTATRSNITNAFLKYSQNGCAYDDRLVVFFAGHGHTVDSYRGQVGFLVPHDGDPRDLSTLIRWDEFTRNADLLPAKHVLFLMDACYGGLMVTRSATPGSVRFVRDMLTRHSRQVLTAGKANETVADSGGPLPNHSIFTGHLLDALSGRAKDNNDNVTANGVMSYVYSRVSNDPDSQQTPHYGYLQGDGDMIFEPRQFPEHSEEPPISERMVLVPVDSQTTLTESPLEQLKELLSEEKYRIKLFDYMAQATRVVMAETAEDNFPLQGPITKESFLERLNHYESKFSVLYQQVMLLARWTTASQGEAMTLPLRRLAERNGVAAGNGWLIASRWYPILLAVYGAGLGAVVGGNLVRFLELIHSPAPSINHGKPSNLLTGSYDGTGEFYDAFKMIPGRERQQVPRSEHIFSVMQPLADDVLFVGSQYEHIFDRVELLMSLEYGHISYKAETGYYWSPIGRFAYRGRHFGPTPLNKMIEEADLAGASWAPLKAGFFGGSMIRFKEIAGELTKIMSNVPWF